MTETGSKMEDHPAAVNRAPVRLPNTHYRPREHLTENEIDRLIKAAGSSRYGHRDATIVLVIYRHGLRPAELVDLRWSEIDFGSATIYIRRANRGTPATHPVFEDELAALRPLQREQNPRSDYVFTSNHGGPFSVASVEKLIKRAGVKAKLEFPVHAQMLRHSCGYKLGRAGHDTQALQAYMGHRNIEHTVKYTKRESGPDRFKDFWK
jgi:integrase